MSRIHAGSATLSRGDENTGETRRSQLTTDGFLWEHTNGTGTVIAKTEIDEVGIKTNGTVEANHVVTNRWRIPVPDYVFEDGYRLRSLEEVESFVRKHKHLPDVPSAAMLQKEGMDIAEMNLHLLKTVEELTLHVIDLKKEVSGVQRNLQKQKARNQVLEGEVRALRTNGKGR
jgi:hypothetical protein